MSLKRIGVRAFWVICALLVVVPFGRSMLDTKPTLTLANKLAIVAYTATLQTPDVSVSDPQFGNTRWKVLSAPIWEVPLWNRPDDHTWKEVYFQVTFFHRRTAITEDHCYSATFEAATDRIINVTEWTGDTPC